MQPSIDLQKLAIIYTTDMNKYELFHAHFPTIF